MQGQPGQQQMQQQPQQQQQQQQPAMQQQNMQPQFQQQGPPQQGGNAMPAPPQPAAQPAFGGAAKKPRRRVLTSLMFQVFLFFGIWWDVFYYIINILVFVYKGVNLPYPARNFDMEFSFSWLWILIEIPRLFLASKGNKTERAAPIIFSFILALPLLGMYVYFVAFQTYVLKLDEILNAIALAFLGIQAAFGTWVSIRFMLAKRITQ